MMVGSIGKARQRTKGRKMIAYRKGVVTLAMLGFFAMSLPCRADDELPNNPKLLKAMVRMYKSSLARKDAQIAAITEEKAQALLEAAKLKKDNVRLASELDRIKKENLQLKIEKGTNGLVEAAKPDAGNDANSKEAKRLDYTIFSAKDISYPGCRRMVYRLILKAKGKPSDPEVKETATYIWKYGNQKWDEFTIFFYLPGMDANGMAYGIAEFRRSGLLKFKVSDFLEASDGSAEEGRRFSMRM